MPKVRVIVEYTSRLFVFVGLFDESDCQNDLMWNNLTFFRFKTTPTYVLYKPALTQRIVVP